MSSFICSAKMFNCVAITLQDLTSSQYFYFPYSLKDAYPALISKGHNSSKHINKVVNDLVDTLRTINVLCVSMQYAHHYPGTLDAEIKAELEAVFNRSEGKQLSKVALLSQLNCLDYQIEINHLTELRELNIAESNAMLFLKEFTNALAMHIVTNTAEYQNVERGM